MDVAGMDIDLSDTEFWGWPLAEPAGRVRRAAHRRPRRRSSPSRSRRSPNPGPGYYALVRHADVVEASRNPEVFCSGRGATSILDLPVEFNEYFGSMINMDDPRHARLRRIVSRAFTPRMIKKFEDDVQRAAAQHRRRPAGDRARATSCEHVAARLPLKIICQMMGIAGRALRDGAAEHQHHLVRRGPRVHQRGHGRGGRPDPHRRAGTGRPGHRPGRSDRPASPADDLVSALVTANIDGEQLTSAELASFFILLVVAGQRDHPERDLARADAAHRLSRTSARCCWPTSRAGSAARSRRSSGTPRRSCSCGARSPGTTR